MKNSMKGANFQAEDTEALSFLKEAANLKKNKTCKKIGRTINSTKGIMFSRIKSYQLKKYDWD